MGSNDQVVPDQKILPAGHALPDGITDAVLNRAQIAAAFKVSENTITKWIAEIGDPMPVKSHGSNGSAYEFQLSTCFSWHLARIDRLHLERTAADNAAAQMALHFLNLDPEGAEGASHMTAKEVTDWTTAEYNRNKAAIQRQEFVPTGRMRTALETMFVTLRNTINTLPDFAEREMGLTAAEVDKLQKRCDQTLVEMHEAVERELKKAPAGVVPIRSSQTELALGS